jgi:putative DNA primase/helicase
MRASPPAAIVSPQNDLRELRLALIGNWPGLLHDLLGKPARCSARQWRWNRRGSLSAVMSGPKAGTWFDHEAGTGGGPFELIARERGGDWRDAADWARSWLGLPAWDTVQRQPQAMPPTDIVACDPHATTGADAAWEAQLRQYAHRAATITWERAPPADPSHGYLLRKGVRPHGARMEGADVLIVPLMDLDGTIHTLQRIYEDGTKRFLSGGAKADHFALIGGPLETAPAILLCEGWATGATAHAATDLPVVAAMDAGNLGRVAPLIQARFPDATLVILADNDSKPGRDTNPGVTAATAAARATNALLAIPSAPGDFNDLAATCGIDAVRDAIWAAAPPAPLTPTYPLAILDLTTIRAMLDDQVAEFMADVAAHWTADPLDADWQPAAPPWANAPPNGPTQQRETACA